MLELSRNKICKENKYMKWSVLVISLSFQPRWNLAMHICAVHYKCLQDMVNWLPWCHINDPEYELIKEKLPNHCGINMWWLAFGNLFIFCHFDVQIKICFTSAEKLDTFWALKLLHWIETGYLTKMSTCKIWMINLTLLNVRCVLSIGVLYLRGTL